MKVKCIDNTKCENILQLGHIYDAEYHHLSNDVFIINHVGAYSKDMFEAVEETKIGLDVLDISQVGGNHYNNNDPIQFARDNYPREQLEGFFRINIDKYVARYDRKNGVEDLRKAQHYLTLLIDLIDNEKNND